LLYYVFTQDWQALPVYAKNFVGVPDGEIGFFLGANGLMVIVLQLPISYAIDRTSRVGRCSSAPSCSPPPSPSF
jgi:hypothetical protein